MSLTHRGLARLWKKNEARNALTGIWLRKHGVDPVDEAKKIWKERRRYLSGKTIITTASLLVSALLFWSAMVLLSPIQPDQTTPVVVTIIVVLSCLASFLNLMAILYFVPWEQDRYTDAQWNYPNLFGKFLEWSNKTAGDVVRLEEVQFVGIAKRVLCDTAESVTRKQYRAEYRTNKKLGEMARSAKSFFDEQLRTFVALGIANKDDHQSIFDKARRKIGDREEEAISACSAECISVTVCRGDVFKHHLTRTIGVDGKITIGSSKSVDIVIDSPDFASIQCVIDTRYDDGINNERTVIENNASKGTIYNGTLLTNNGWDDIKSGAEIQVGDYTLIIYLPDTIAPEPAVAAGVQPATTVSLHDGSV